MNPSVVIRAATGSTTADGISAWGHEREHVSIELSVESIYAQQGRFVWRVLRGMGVPPSRLEDTVQDVFVVVQRRLPEFDGRSTIRTWLFAIAYRVACDQRRKLRRALAHEPISDDFSDRAPSPESDAERAQAARLLSALLDRLPDDKRLLLVLSEIEGMTVPEIAALTGTGVNTVYTRLRRAREQFDRALSAHKKRMR